jgi:membrane protein DedA with SNARE-associated domain
MLEHIIQTYGYMAVYVGTIFEGETILILAGIMVHAGYLKLPYIIIAAFSGSLTADQVMFHIGRRRGASILAHRPKWNSRVQQVLGLVNRFRTSIMIVFRFLYGLRIVTPFALGMTNVSAVKFLFYNIIGALVWSSAIASGGYLFGKALGIILGDIKHYEYLIFLFVIGVGFIVWIAHLLSEHYKPPTKKEGEPESS